MTHIVDEHPSRIPGTSRRERAPARTPAPVVGRFHEALVAAFREERVSRQMTDAQQARLALAGPDELGRFLAREVETWGEVVRANGIRAD